MSVREDADWVQRTLRGDPEAFDQLDRRYRPLLYGVALSYLRDPQLAQEVAQDALIRGYTHLDDLEAPDRFGGWLKAIVRNLCIDHRRREIRIIPLDRLCGDSLQGTLHKPELDCESEEMCELVRSGIDALSPDLREPLLLFYTDEYSQQEISEFLNLSKPTIERRLRRARQQLRDHLEWIYRNTIAASLKGAYCPAFWSTPWTTVGYDLQRTGSTQDGLTPPLRHAYTLSLSGPTGCMRRSVVIEEGVVYVSGMGPAIYAVDLSSRERRWGFTGKGNWKRSLAIWKDALYATELVQAVEGSVLYKLDKHTGEKLWDVPVPGEPECPAVVNDLVYVGYGYYWDGPFGMKAYAADSGEEVWAYTHTHTCQMPAFSADGSRLFASTAGGELLCLDALTGDMVWSYDTGWPWGTPSPVVVDEVVYFASGHQRINLYAADAATGEILWERFVANAEYASQMMAIAGDRILLGTSGNEVYAARLEDGEIVWVQDCGGWIEGGFVVADEIAYAVSHQGTVYALDTETGECRWHYETGAMMDCVVPAISEGCLVTMGHRGGRGHLFVFETELVRRRNRMKRSAEKADGGRQ